MTKQKKSRFWLIYGIITAVAVIAICVLLAVFYDVVAVYERSQPSTAAEDYVSRLTEEALTKAVTEAVASLDLKYESGEDYVKMFTDVFDKDSLICRKRLTDTTTHSQVFSVICRDTELLRLTLERVGGDKYGFDLWMVTDTEVPLDGIIENGRDYTLYVPAGSTLSVNGYTPVTSETSVPFPINSALEDARLPECDLYRLGTLYTTPEIDCTENGKSCTHVPYDGVYVYLSAGLGNAVYSVTAPAGAAVLVNGVTLTDEYVTETGISEDCSPIESGMDGLPTRVAYSTGVLFTSPVITASLNGVPLEAVTDGTDCSFAYPEELTYTLTVKVPAGADASVGGVYLGDVTEAVEESVLMGLDTGEACLPLLDVYTVTGLYNSSHEVNASLNGTPLVLSDESTDRELIYTADYSSVTAPEVAERALSFVKAYFNYTSQGYNNTEENIAAALAYVDGASELYRRILNSKMGYDYVTPVTGEIYRTLEVSKIYRLSDGTYAVKVNFHVDQTIVYVNRTYKGEISLHITDAEDTMMIRDMVIVNE